ncbi:gliding motility protein [Archangium lansingense]|uniref:Gliding motility protein n=1 Tax=Archangium lansingense TaxID=2995310 RepID=A0ABT4ACZ5_9BACT|nr:gliding motility protein [Archangium lansinium]MCY1079543.1 gliding motility protein [Archangium lansinium]
METPQQRLERETREVEQALRGLFAMQLDDGQLRQGVEQLGTRWAFPGLIALWGPGLYYRNRTVFRPFILARFPQVTFDTSGRPQSVFKGPSAELFEKWLQDVDRSGDVELFRRLYRLQLQDLSWAEGHKRWLADLQTRYGAASTRAQRQGVLNQFDLYFELDEPTAITLYTADSVVSRGFILEHLPGIRWIDFGRRSPWQKLSALARERGDEALAFDIYRRQVPEETWKRDVLALGDTLQEPGALVEALEQRHPAYWLRDAATPFLELARKRGRAVVPYLLRHIRNVRQPWGPFNRSFSQLVELAREREWLDLWSALMRTSAAPKTYNSEMLGLLQRSPLPEGEVRRRLLLLTGVGREANFPGLGLAQVQPLEDDTAVLLYERFPDLVRGPFLRHVSSGWSGTYPKLTARALALEDAPLVDFLASRVALQDLSYVYLKQPSPWTRVIEQLSAFYESLLQRSPDAFASRAANVLGKMPAFAIRDYGALVRSNRLARLFFERAHAHYAADARAIRDLLESPQIHVQALAFRVLARDDERARALAARNVDLLQATLLRPLHRKTRVMALGALRNAIRDEAAARQLAGHIRDAMDLPDRRYPKEVLLGLLADLLHRWPELRGPSEQPVVYGGAA